MFQKCFSQAVHTYETRYMRHVPGKYNTKILREPIFKTEQDIFHFYREIQNSSHSAKTIKHASLLKLTYATSKIIGNPSLKADVHPILDQIFLSEELKLRFQMEARNTPKIQDILKKISEIIDTNTVKLLKDDIDTYQKTIDYLHNESTLTRFGDNGNIDTTIESLQTLAQNLSLQEADRQLLTQLLSELQIAFDTILSPGQIISKQKGKYLHLKHKESTEIQHLEEELQSLKSQ